MAKQEFSQWMRKVDALISASIGLGANDLEDHPYYDWYEDGVSPASAAKRVIRSAGLLI